MDPIHSKGEQSSRQAKQGKRYGLHRKQCPSERIAWAKSKLLISFYCILFLGKQTSHIICCLASIGISLASVLSSPKVYCIERPSLESEQWKEEEPYRYSVMNTMWIRSKAPNSKYSVRGAELPFPGTILRLRAFFFPGICQSEERNQVSNLKALQGMWSPSQCLPLARRQGESVDWIHSWWCAANKAYLFSQCNPAF